ncbi:MAG: hypothetical protein BalsKO_10660 [Balneolaceae bacterium]
MSKNSLTDKIMVVVFSRILTALIDLTTAILLARMLSKAEVGIVWFVLPVYEVARSIAVMGFPESIFYYFEHLTKNYRRAFALQTSAILFLTGSIAAIAILVVQKFAPLFLTNFSPEAISSIQEFLPLIAIVAVLEVPTWPVHNVLLASDRQKEAGWYQIITSIFSFVAIVGPLVLGLPLIYLFYSMIGYAVLRFVLSMCWMLLILPSGELKTPKGNFREQIIFSIPLGVSTLVNIFNKNADKFIVSVLLAETALAEYAIGAQEISLIRVIPFAVGTVLISRYVQLKIKGATGDIIRLWHKGINKVSLIVIPFTIMSIALAPYLINLFETEGSEYQNSIIIFQIYNLLVLIRVAHYGSILQAFGDTSGIMRLSMSLILLNIIISTPLTMLYGITGTAAGTLIANLINWMFWLKRISAHLDIPMFQVLPFQQYGKILVISMFPAIIVYFMSTFFEDFMSWVPNLVLSSVIFIILYLFIGKLTNVIDKEDWKSFRRLIGLKYLWR